MKQFILLFLTTLWGNQIKAQHFDWTTSGGSVSGRGHYNGTIDIAKDTSGNYYVLTNGSVEAQQCQGDTIEPFETQSTNAFIYKFNADGIIQYISKIGSKSLGTSFNPLALECDEVGNVYVLGHPNGGNQMSAGLSDFFITPHNNIIVKFDVNGDYEWFYQTNYFGNVGGASTLLKYHNHKLYFQFGQTTINCIDHNKVLLHTLTASSYVPHTAWSGPSYRSAEVMSNGDIVFMEVARGDIHYDTHSFVLPNKGYWLDAAVMLKTKSNLDVEWLKMPYHLYNPSRGFIPIAIDQNDNIYLGCELADTAIVGPDTIFNYTRTYNGNGAVLKFDKDGNGVWGKFLQTSINTVIYAMTQSNDSTGIYFGGGIQGTTYFDTIKVVNTTNITTTVAYLAKFDYNGNFTNAFIAAPNPTQNDVYAIIADGKNGYVIGGKLESNDTIKFQCIEAPKNRGFYFTHFQDIDSTVPMPIILLVIIYLQQHLHMVG
jgi:hypothetical protein